MSINSFVTAIFINFVDVMHGSCIQNNRLLGDEVNRIERLVLQASDPRHTVLVLYVL